jgi:hypothetical protein
VKNLLAAPAEKAATQTATNRSHGRRNRLHHQQRPFSKKTHQTKNTCKRP